METESNKESPPDHICRLDLQMCIRASFGEMCKSNVAQTETTYLTVFACQVWHIWPGLVRQLVSKRSTGECSLFSRGTRQSSLKTGTSPDTEEYNLLFTASLFGSTSHIDCIPYPLSNLMYLIAFLIFYQYTQSVLRVRCG